MQRIRSPDKKRWMLGIGRMEDGYERYRHYHYIADDSHSIGCVP